MEADLILVLPLTGRVAELMVKKYNTTISLDDIKTTGIYASYLFADKPCTAGVAILEVINYSSGYLIQRFTVIDGELAVYLRKYNNNIFSQWSKIG